MRGRPAALTVFLQQRRLALSAHAHSTHHEGAHRQGTGRGRRSSHGGRVAPRRPALSIAVGPAPPPAPVLALREDRSPPRTGRPRRHPHDSAAPSRRSPGAGRNDPPRAPFLTIRGSPPAVAPSRTRTTSRTRTAAASAGGARDAPLIARVLPVRGSGHRGDPRCTADRGVLHIGERRPRGPIPGFPHDSAILASHWSCVDALPCAEGPALHMGGFHQRRVPGRFRMIPRILRWRVPIECAAPPRPAPIPHVRPGSAPRLGPTALVPLPPPTPAPMLTS